MKSRVFVFGVVFAAILFLYQRLVDSQAQLAQAQAELGNLKREQAAREQVYAEAYQANEAFDEDYPLPDNPDKKMRVAMLDAIISAEVRDELGEHYAEDEEEES